MGDWKGMTEELLCSQQSKTVGDWLKAACGAKALTEQYINCELFLSFACNLKNKTAVRDFRRQKHLDREA